MHSNRALMARVATAAVVMLTLAGCQRGQDTENAAYATVYDGDGTEIGTADFRTVAGGVGLHFEAHGLPSGAHGIHIHEQGECDPPAFESAGGHFNPTDAEHGLLHHEHHLGDLPNLEIDKDGNGRIDYVIEGVNLDAIGPRSLLAGAGTALVIHAYRDNQDTDPSGESGRRIACGIIKGR